MGFEIGYENNLDEQDLKKMVAAIQLIALAPTLPNLKKKKISLQLCELEKTFVLMNAILPYYPPVLRPYWNLVGVFDSCEKIQGVYFHVLNQLLGFDKIDFPLFNQIRLFFYAP